MHIDQKPEKKRRKGVGRRSSMSGRGRLSGIARDTSLLYKVIGACLKQVVNIEYRTWTKGYRVGYETRWVGKNQ